MKIAVVTDNLLEISQHYGHAAFYMVFTVENGQILDQQIRKKAGHQSAAHSCHNCHAEQNREEGHDCHDEKHGMDAASQSDHAAMSSNITDCQVVLAGGMGYGAFQSLQSAGIEPFITDVAGIEEAVYLYAEGKLVNLMEKLH
jgi:predicted Fe-Mo cluster-binding NifX family protein